MAAAPRRHAGGDEQHGERCETGVGQALFGARDGGEEGNVRAPEGSDLSGDDFGLYSLLRVFGPVTPTQIARWTGMRPTTVSAALRRMSGRGHSEQRRNPDDGRSYLIWLNEAGRTAHRQAAGPFLQVMSRVGAALQPDEHAQRIALQRLDSALRATTDLDARPTG